MPEAMATAKWILTRNKRSNKAILKEGKCFWQNCLNKIDEMQADVYNKRNSISRKKKL